MSLHSDAKRFRSRITLNWIVLSMHFVWYSSCIIWIFAPITCVHIVCNTLIISLSLNARSPCRSIQSMPRLENNFYCRYFHQFVLIGLILFPSSFQRKSQIRPCAAKSGVGRIKASAPATKTQKCAHAKPFSGMITRRHENFSWHIFIFFSPRFFFKIRHF